MEWIKEFQNKNKQSLVSYLLENLSNQVRSEFSIKMEDYLKNNLSVLGFVFQNQDDFYDFCKTRITKAHSLNSPEDYEFFLDYGTKEQKLIGKCNTSTSYEWSDDHQSLTVSVGKKIE